MKKLPLEMDTQIIRNESDFLFTEVDNEIVLMSITNDDLFSMNPMAAFIWKLLGKQQSFGALIEQLTLQFKVEKEQCIQEVKAWILEMIKVNIVQKIQVG